MNEKVLKSLVDIKSAIDEINSFFLNREKRFDEYSNDILLKRAIERDLEIVGEAMNRILNPHCRVDGLYMLNFGQNEPFFNYFEGAYFLTV